MRMKPTYVKSAWMPSSTVYCSSVDICLLAPSAADNSPSVQSADSLSSAWSTHLGRKDCPRTKLPPTRVLYIGFCLTGFDGFH